MRASVYQKEYRYILILWSWFVIIVSECTPLLHTTSQWPDIFSMEWHGVLSLFCVGALRETLDLFEIKGLFGFQLMWKIYIVLWEFTLSGFMYMNSFSFEYC